MTAEQISQAIAEAGLQPLAPGIPEKFADYLSLLLKWNARLNLTAIREPSEILQRHFMECIFAAQHLPSGIQTLLDFGSGGGFPGIPIALCRPEIAVTLGESQSKKASFLREAVRTLSLGNVQVFNGRIETLDCQFDAVALRAVDKMQEASEIALEKVRPSGYLVLLTTPEAQPSLAHIAWTSPMPIPDSSTGCLLIGRKA